MLKGKQAYNEVVHTKDLQIAQVCVSVCVCVCLCVSACVFSAARVRGIL